MSTKLAEASWRRRWRAREQGVEVRDVAVRERARLDLEAVVPVSVSQPFARIASEGEGTRLPLTDDVAVLVQHEPGIGEELGGAAGEIDAATARGRDRAPVGSRIPGVLDDPHVADARAEHPLERFPQSLRHLSVVSGPHRTAPLSKRACGPTPCSAGSAAPAPDPARRPRAAPRLRRPRGSGAPA